MTEPGSALMVHTQFEQHSVTLGVYITLFFWQDLRTTLHVVSDAEAPLTRGVDKVDNKVYYTKWLDVVSDAEAPLILVLRRLSPLPFPPAPLVTRTQSLLIQVPAQLRLTRNTPVYHVYTCVWVCSLCMYTLYVCMRVFLHKTIHQIRI